MIALFELEEYDKILQKGIKKLDSYHSWMRNFSMLSFFISIGSMYYIYELIIKFIKAKDPDGQLTVINIKAALNAPDTFNIMCALLALLVLSLIFNIIHKKRLENQIKSYVQDIHPMVISKHKNIFADHAPEAIDAFREERDKSRLLIILTKYHENMSFVINNYNNFSEDK